MPNLALLLRRVLQLSAASLAIGILISCASKKEKSPSAAEVAATSGKKKPGSPAAAPSPIPSPAPTPQVTYIATAKVDGVDVTPPQATPSPVPAVSPTSTPTPTPGPTPKPKSSPLSFVGGIWRKILPPKPTPTPIPHETGRITVRVTGADGRESEQVVREGTETAPTAAMPAPTPIQLKLRPTEWIGMRMWHKVFPKKQEPPAAAPPIWTGTIKLVNERENYALIDSPTSFSVPVGETLNSVGGDAESGVLRVTADRNPPFFIADIVSGKPHAGDRVYSPKP